MKKRITSAILAVCLAMTLLPVNAWAEEADPSGTCGTNVKWTLDSDGVLTISGTGDMETRDFFWEHKDRITSAVIEEGVTSIVDYAFSGCANLTSVTIPGSVRSIGEKAFSECAGLTSVTIPNGVTSIGTEAFSFCGNLTSVTIPGTVTSIGNYAFAQCKSLTGVTMLDGTMDDMKTSIGEGAFLWCESLTSVGIPKSVTSIGKEAFAQCTSLTSVTIPGSVTSIGKEAFAQCTSLTGVTILNGITDGMETSIGEGAFSGCGSLTSVGIPKSVTSIEKDAFEGCGGLKDVYYVDSAEDVWKNIAIGGGNEFLTGVNPTYDSMLPAFYTVTFDSQGGSPVKKSQTVPVGEEVTEPAPPTRDGYTFDGWYEEADCKNPWKFDTKVTIDTGDITLYAKWTEKIPVVTFDPKGGTMDSPTSVSTEADHTLSELPEPKGKCLKFEGWYKPDGSEVVANKTVFDKDTTVYAKWTEEHTPGDDESETEEHPATCTEDGSKTITYTCTVCNQKITEKEAIPATGHTEEVISAVQATCTTAGTTEGKKCSVCNTILVEPQEIPTIEHTKETVAGKEATCTETGLTEGSECSVCGETLTAQEVIPALGHSWGDWDSSDTDQVTRTCTVCGKTEYQKAVKIELAGGTPSDDPGVLATDEDDCITTLPAAPTREGYTFAGWYTAEPDSKELKVGEKLPEDMGTIYAHWSKAKYTVTFDLNYDGAPASTTASVTHGEKVSSPEADPTRDGFTFQGWFKDEACETEWVFDDAVTGPITLYAKWEKADGGEDDKPKEFTITFDANGGSVSPTSAVTDADGKVTLPTPTRTGYTFDGWYTAKTGGEKVTVSATKFEKDATLYAHWTQNSTTPAGKTYTITFNANGGSVSPTSAVTDADGKVTLPTPTRAGYTFTGWYTTATGGTQVTASKVFTADTTIYAHWSQSTGTYYRIYTPGVTYGGSLYVSHSSAAPGTLVTVTSSPWSNYTLNQLSAIRTDTGREVSLTARYSSQYTFLMPDSDVQLIGSYTQTYTGAVTPSYPGTNTGSSNPGYAGASAGSRTVNWYYSGGNIYHATDGLVPVGTALTRDMLVSVLYNMDSTSSGSPTIWAAENNILPDIYQSGLWGTDKPISREQAAMILLCYARHKGYATSQTANLTGYTDYSQIRTIARPAMAWSQAIGLITATSARTLSPQAILTCSEANAILNRFVSSVASGW